MHFCYINTIYRHAIVGFMRSFLDMVCMKMICISVYNHTQLTGYLVNGSTP